MELKRVVVVGTSGSGKSTLARRLALALGTRHIELDALFWNPGWEQTPREEFARRVAEAISEESWVLDGNYAFVRDLVWSRATIVLWLRYPLRITFGRLLMRTIRRAIPGEECCNGNRESLKQAFFSRDSILFWALTSHPVYEKEYPLEIERHPHLTVVQLTRPRDADAFLEGLARP